MVVFGASGDALLARGVKQTGAIDIHHIFNVFAVLSNPYILLGIVSLLIFMWSYMTALSFADLSFVMPATAISYVLMTLLSIFWLHEHVGPERWSGILFIVLGVGLVAKFFLKEDVNRRRWLATGFVFCGVLILTYT